jgi:hypothetical protein
MKTRVCHTGDRQLCIPCSERPTSC